MSNSMSPTVVFLAQAQPLSVPGEIVDLRPTDAALSAHQQTLLIKTDDVQILQLIIPTKGCIPTFEAQGQIIVHCLEGFVRLCTPHRRLELHAGQLLYLQALDPFSIECLDQAALLVTLIAAKQGPNVALIGEQELKSK